MAKAARIREEQNRKEEALIEARRIKEEFERRVRDLAEVKRLKKVAADMAKLEEMKRIALAEAKRLEEEALINADAQADADEEPTAAGEECKLTLDLLSKKTGRSWMTFDWTKKEHDKIKFTKPRRNRICLFGSKSIRNCFKMKDGKLTHVNYAGVTATLKDNGELKWSHGYTSAFDEPLCP